jgi:hypothetical protein
MTSSTWLNRDTRTLETVQDLVSSPSADWIGIAECLGRMAELTSFTQSFRKSVTVHSLAVFVR